MKLKNILYLKRVEKLKNYFSLDYEPIPKEKQLFWNGETSRWTKDKNKASVYTERDATFSIADNFSQDYLYSFKRVTEE